MRGPIGKKLLKYMFICKGFLKMLYVLIRIIIDISAGVYIQIGVASR